jgi:L-alanine-DL-glutamate epimerase-like enolase superfamily enzyme
MLPVAASVATIALTVWDIRNSITIGKMRIAWDTGAPVWPYPTPEDGYFVIEDKPGLGIETNPDVAKAHLAPGETWWG